MINFCTLFDSGYLTRGIAMVDSLIENTKQTEFHTHILALDLVSERFLRDSYKANTKITIYNLSELGDEYVWNLRKGRSHREFCWGLSAILVNFILEKTAKTTIYLDAPTAKAWPIDPLA